MRDAGGELHFTLEQEAAMRAALGFRDGDRELTPDDLIVAFEAEAILRAEAARLAGELADGGQ